jgi:integrase
MSCDTIATVLRGINNKLGKRPNRKEPILTEDLKKMLEAISIARGCLPNLIGLRDRALLLLGFSGAFRRSELVALTMADIKFTRDGFIALVRRSKTDQAGEGIEKIIPYGNDPLTCPVRAMQDWLAASEIKEGAIFRAIDRHGNMAKTALAGNAVARIIKRNPYIRNNEENFSGHSLRSGFITSAVKRGVPTDLIMQQTGHKSVAEMNGYIRRGKSFKETASAMVGL